MHRPSSPSSVWKAFSGRDPDRAPPRPPSLSHLPLRQRRATSWVCSCVFSARPACKDSKGKSSWIWQAARRLRVWSWQQRQRNVVSPPSAPLTCRHLPLWKVFDSWLDKMFRTALSDSPAAEVSTENRTQKDEWQYSGGGVQSRIDVGEDGSTTSSTKFW